MIISALLESAIGIPSNGIGLNSRFVLQCNKSMIAVQHLWYLDAVMGPTNG